jgi:hypothetical protein
MAFPLMRGYDHINVVAELEPVAAARDEDLGERMRTYRKLFPAGSEFGHAVQTGRQWRIGSLGAFDPAGARYSLAAELRRGAAEEDTRFRRAMLNVADRLDPEEGEQLPKDEWEIGDRRYRVIRVEKFTLIGKRVMEPPRLTDADPVGDARYLVGHLLDPMAPAGRWEAQLRLNLVAHLPIRGTVPDIVMTEARHAVRTHPGVVLLPPTFIVVEIKGESWDPLTSAEGPDEARTNLAEHFSMLLPRLREFQQNPASPEEIAEWEKAAARIETMSGPEFHVLERRFRIVRVSRALRLGRDGPEAPRPSDQERYGSTQPQA